MALGGLLCANFPAKKQIVAAIKSCHGPAMTARRPITAIVKGTPICALYGEVERRPRREGAGKEREAVSREALRLPGKRALSSGMEGKKPLGISKETIKEWGKTDFLLTYLRGEINNVRGFECCISAREYNCCFFIITYKENFCLLISLLIHHDILIIREI